MVSASHARPCGDICWAAWETELSSAFFGDGVIEFVFLGKIRGRICFSLCPRRQTRRRAKLWSAELMLQHHLLCGQLSPCTSCFPKNQTLQDWDLGSRGLEKASSLPLTGVFLSLFFEATLAHYFYFPSPWTYSSCPHLQGPVPWPHLCPVVQKANNSEAFQPRRLSLHIEGHFCHLLSMKCGFQYIIWKQKRKNHRGPSCKNNHYPLK